MSGAVSPNSPWKLRRLWGVRIYFPDWCCTTSKKPEIKRWFCRELSLLPSLPACIWWYVGCELGRERGEMEPPKAVLDSCVWATVLHLEDSKEIKADCLAMVSVCRAYRFHRLAGDDGGWVWLWGRRKQEGSPLQTIYSCWVFRVIEEGNCCTFMHLIHGLPGEEGGNYSSVGNGSLLQGRPPPAWSSLFPVPVFSLVPGSFCWGNWWHHSELLGKREGELWVIWGLFFKGAVLFLMSGFEVRIMCMEI